MPRLRWGLLSTARINRAVIPAIRASARSELTAVASRTLDRAREYAAEWHVPRALESYEALVNDPDVDVLYIPLPNHLHVPWSIRAAEAGKHVAAARKILDSDAAIAAEQERFYPYLTGYVALYTGDFAKAEAEMTKALAAQGNQNDPFMNLLLAMTYEKLGDSAKAKALYEKSYSLATAHNPPSAFARPYTRKKLGVR